MSPGQGPDPLLVPVDTCVRGSPAPSAVEQAPTRFVDHLGVVGISKPLVEIRASLVPAFSLDPPVIADRSPARRSMRELAARKREGASGGFEESASPTQSASLGERRLRRLTAVQPAWRRSAVAHCSTSVNPTRFARGSALRALTIVPSVRTARVRHRTGSGAIVGKVSESRFSGSHEWHRISFHWFSRSDVRASAAVDPRRQQCVVVEGLRAWRLGRSDRPSRSPPRCS